MKLPRLPASCLLWMSLLSAGVTLGSERPWLGHEARAAATRPRAGDKAPAFVLKTVDKGEPKALADLLREKEGAGRGVVLAFLSAECPYVAQARQPLGELFRT
ncbi:MAG TPA: hypothetical protein VHU40_18985, partial [Polyangia bacterium]|nr:hypothetical protein [Polyangia bacterium]